MQLLAQLDTNDLPVEMINRLGGGRILQLFVPMDVSRSLPWDDQAWNERDYPFETRVLDKTDGLVWIDEPVADLNGNKENDNRYSADWKSEYGAFKLQYIKEWKERVDLPFSLEEAAREIGWRAKQVELDLCEEHHYHGDKLGSWLSLEQGPIVPDDWDHPIQISGGGVAGDQVAFDGKGWLVKSPWGEFKWITVSD